MKRALVGQLLASAFLATEWTRRELLASAKDLGADPSVRGLVARIRKVFPRPPRDAFDDLAAFVADDVFVRRAVARRAPFVVRFGAARLAMRPAHRDWALPELATTGDIARWLGLSIGDLAWLADARGFSARPRDPRLEHYVRRWIPKKDGERRLLEAPKRSLKEAQRRILDELLVRIPTHAAAHGFVRGRSVQSHAAAHVGQRVVLRMDLADFFLSVRGAWVTAIFREAGYPQEVARVLMGLCTTVACIDGPREARLLAARRHLPQGAPTSPALANLAAYGLDVRLAALAARHDAIYTRYADDLVFSGPLPRALASVVERIVWEEGFALNRGKTRRMPRATQQRITGLVVNTTAAVPRRERDALEAILTNCLRTSPAEQNRARHPDFRAWLEGRIGWVRSAHPAHAARLDALFARIVWPSAA